MPYFKFTTKNIESFVIKTNFSRGFTLIEILVAVIITGILGAIALPQYNKTLERFKYAEAEEILNLAVSSV